MLKQLGKIDISKWERAATILKYIFSTPAEEFFSRECAIG